MPRPPDTKLMRCRYCEFTVLRFKRYRNGKVHHGHDKLQEHVLNSHYDTYYPVILQEEQDWLADPATLGGADMEDHPFDYL